MFRTWDERSGSSSRWVESADQTRGHPLGEFLEKIDLMLYIAVAGFAASIAALLMD